QHLGSWHKGRSRRGGRAEHCSLVATEKEDLVFPDWAADHAAKLIAFQRVLRSREEIPGVHVAVAEELKQVAVKRVRAGLGYRIHLGARVGSGLGILGAGVDLELLESVGKREGQVRGV